MNRKLLKLQKNTGCWAEAGSLSRIRSSITCTGSTSKCNPAISLLYAACRGSQVVPICSPLARLGLVGCDASVSRMCLLIHCSTDCDLQFKRIWQDSSKTHPHSYLFVFSSCAPFAYSIDLYKTTHPAAAADLVDGCHKQLSQIQLFNTEVL